MGAVTIRRAEAADAALLAELAARTFAETFGPYNSQEDIKSHLESSYGIARQADEIADPDVRTLLAFRSDQLIGFTQVRRKDIPTCVVATEPVELHRFYFTRSAQGTGAAKLLMRKAREAARELGGLNMWLGVWERNPRAIAFYLKSGFTKVGSHDFVVGADTQTDWVFSVSLSNDDAYTSLASVLAV